MSSYRCHRDAFTQQEYDKYEERFWMMPPSIGSLGGGSLLAQLWELGGSGAICILPILGQFANSQIRDDLKLAKEEMARLGGIDVATVRRGEQALLTVGLLDDTSPAIRHGKTLTRWKLSSGLAAQSSDTERARDYFCFKSKLVYGGNWARMTRAQRALYLAVGLMAKTYPEPIAENKLLNATLSPAASRQDLLDCYACHAEKPHLRLGLLSFTELSTISGVSKSALHTAVNALKRPESWPGVDGDPAALHHAPLAVYPTQGGSLLYHLRDHAPHWPWDELNRQPERAHAAVAGDGNWSDELEVI